MKLSCEKSMLQSGLELVSGIIETRTSIPILSNILIETTDGKTLKLSATNLEIGIEYFVDADISKQGSITIPGKKFTSVVKELSEDIYMEAAKNIVIVKSDKAELKIVGIPRDEFPRINVNTDYIVTLPQKVMKEILDKTAFSMSTDDTRYILKGVFLVIDGQQIVAVATDGKRLSYVKAEADNASNSKKKVVIPANSVNELRRILRDEGEIKIAVDENHVTFICDRIHIVSKVIEGNYPDYEQVIPKKSSIQMTLKREEVMNILKRALYFTTEDNKRILFQVEKGQIWLRAKSHEFGEFEEKIEGEVNTEKFEIAFNLDFLLQVTKHLDQETITLEMNAQDKAVVIKEGTNQLYLVMPMKISDRDE